MTKSRASVCVALAVCAALIACGEEPESPITEEALRQGTYLTQFVEGGRVTLTDGQFQSRPVEGATADLSVSLGRFGMGDLNADQREDAAVVLVERRGQMETLTNLHAVLAGDGTIRDVAWVLLGERPRVSEVRIDSGLIHVDLLGDEELRDGRSEVRPVVYALTDKGLRMLQRPNRPEANAVPREGPETSRMLSGVEWKLVSIEMEDEVVTPVLSARGDPVLVFTREFGDATLGSGRMSGQAGCNRIFGNYRIGPADSLSLSSIATTLMSCSTRVMEIERRLIRALELTRTYRRSGDELTLEFVDGVLRLSGADG